MHRLLLCGRYQRSEGATYMVSVATPNCFFLLEKIADPGVRALNPPPPPTPDIRNQGPGPGTAPGTRSRWSGTPGDQESPGPGPPGGHRSPGPRTPGGCRRHRVRHPGVRESPGPPPRFWQLASRGKKNNLCRQQPKVRRTLPHGLSSGARATSGPPAHRS